MRVTKHTPGRQSGIALLTTILLLLLMTSLLVGFVILITSSQRISGMNSDYSRAFYAAEAGMEKLTADIGTLFNNTYAPSAAQVNALMATPPPLSGIQYVNPDASNGYNISFPKDANGNPKAVNTTISSGAYQGMVALATPYTLQVTARTANGSEVRLMRTTQTVGIPMFQFGTFSETDLSFFPGPNFNFGGRTHTNGNLFLAAGATLSLSDKVTAYGDVIRQTLSNGYPLSSGGYGGTVNITTSPGSTSYRALGLTEGSLTGGLGSTPNTNWTNISMGATNYAGNLRNGAFGASRGTGVNKLNLAIVTLGNAQPIDILRRPVKNEDTTSPGVLGERFFAQASVKILLSDDPNDLMQLPCIDSTVQPFHLDDLAAAPALWSSVPALALKTAMTTAGTTPLPLATSGAASTTVYTSADGYWVKTGKPLITGYLKIEVQTAYGSPCGTWKDVTQEILSLGYAGRNLFPATGANNGTQTATKLLALPTAELTPAPSSCADPHPNAVIRLERMRDNPSSIPLGTLATPVTPTAAQACGVSGTTVLAQNPSDFWPTVLFDTREGSLRDVCPSGSCTGTQVMMNGVMHYVELDMNNLGRWLTGAIASAPSGVLAKDPNIAPYDFTVYFSDRRGNYVSSLTGAWPPTSPSTHETGEYGFEDFVNPASQYGCPNGTVDAGEDLDKLGTGTLFTYGQDPTYALTLSAYQFLPVSQGSGSASEIAVNPNCTVASPSAIWPGSYIKSAMEARENPPLFFRRALKLVNGKLLNFGTCPSGVGCGLSVASENPAYVQGDYNANSAAGGFNDPQVATALLADAVTFLSNNWNDVNSFAFPYLQNTTHRNASTSYYRTGVVAGKGVSFPQPTGYTTPQDFGTDGGVHNFLRYIENWGGQTLNYRGSILSLFYNRQATGVYKCCTLVYNPPTRGYNFDTNFLNPTLLPPRTPMFRDINTTGFSQLIRTDE